MRIKDFLDESGRTKDAGIINHISMRHTDAMARKIKNTKLSRKII
jgi:hypothetical protein